MSDRQRCETCRFLRERRFIALQCVRFPPRAGEFDGSLAQFPIVAGDWWCGEWQPQEPEK